MADHIEPGPADATCLGCGADIYGDDDRSFAFGPDAYLCFQCAVDRGGVYDEEEDRWLAEPNVESLPDERRPHA